MSTQCHLMNCYEKPVGQFSSGNEAYAYCAKHLEIKHKDMSKIFDVGEITMYEHIPNVGVWSPPEKKVPEVAKAVKKCKIHGCTGTPVGEFVWGKPGEGLLVYCEEHLKVKHKQLKAYEDSWPVEDIKWYSKKSEGECYTPDCENSAAVILEITHEKTCRYTFCQECADTRKKNNALPSWAGVVIKDLGPIEKVS